MFDCDILVIRHKSSWVRSFSVNTLFISSDRYLRTSWSEPFSTSFWSVSFVGLFRLLICSKIELISSFDILKPSIYVISSIFTYIAGALCHKQHNSKFFAYISFITYFCEKRKRIVTCDIFLRPYSSNMLKHMALPYVCMIFAILPFPSYSVELHM